MAKAVRPTGQREGTIGGAGTPDVSVIVPVYNTMPYLTRCLTSLVRQTIGLDRMQVIAVNDGSTDRSGRELDRFALRHPGLFTVLHQANSGGPAGPCNRALDVATGRYVFFVGSDDWLGPEALERLVTAADTYRSDVVLGRVVGVNSRHIFQDIFARSAPAIDLFDSPLPRSLANTKLFRRELLERHGIRYPEGWPLGSDQPFTLAACYRAERISVLADYDFYYAVRRFGASNITYRTRHLERLRAAEAMMAFAADLIPPGGQRDRILSHYFDHNVAKLLEDDFLRLDRATQQRVHGGVGRLVSEHLTAGIAARLRAETRIRTALSRHGGLDDLLAVIRQDAQIGVPATVGEAGRRYAGYPGFRGAGRGLPDSCFDVTTAPDWAAKLDATALAWEVDDRGERWLTITAHTPVSPLAAFGVDGLAVHAEDIPADVRVTAEDTAGSTVRIRFSAAELLARSDPGGQRRVVSARALTRVAASGHVPDAAGEAGAREAGADLRAPGAPRLPRLMRRRRGRLYVIAPSLDDSGRLVIAVVPITLNRLLVHTRRTLRR
jgi:glycosyltransferase involved in cell wall biosynthesis